MDDGLFGTGQCACCGPYSSLYNYACCTSNCYKWNKCLSNASYVVGFQLPHSWSTVTGCAAVLRLLAPWTVVRNRCSLPLMSEVRRMFDYLREERVMIYWLSDKFYSFSRLYFSLTFGIAKHEYRQFIESICYLHTCSYRSNIAHRCVHGCRSVARSWYSLIKSRSNYATYQNVFNYVSHGLRTSHRNIASDHLPRLTTWDASAGMVCTVHALRLTRLVFE
jgi:hypothetical protein